MNKPFLFTLAFGFIMHASIAADARIPISMSTATLPSRVDNRTTPYFPPIINQVGESCSNANGVGYIFTYEINACRDVPSVDPANQFPYYITYSYLNGGSEKNGTHTMFLDAWKIIRSNGISNAIDFGPIEPRSTKWVSGYDKYYRGMQNRVALIDSLSFLDPGTLAAMKQWLFDHGNGSPAGGIFTITASAFGIQDAKISTGPETGKYIIHTFGQNPTSGPHTYAVVGYDDSIRYDFNKDGKVSTTIDINNDNKIDQADRELGAFICANTWGESSWDKGFTYAPYRLFMTPASKGGTLTNRAYFITVRKEYRPTRVVKVTLTGTQRNKLVLSVGIASDSSAAVPAHTRVLQQYNHTGGNLPMCGSGESSRIELGLDVSDLLDSVEGATSAAYFLIVDSETGNDSCNALSLMDYSSTNVGEIAASRPPTKLSAGKNIFRIAAPPLNVINLKKIIPLFAGPMVCQSGRSIRIHVSPGKNRIQFFRSDGRCVVSLKFSGSGGWYTLPVRLRPGTYFIRATDYPCRKVVFY